MRELVLNLGKVTFMLKHSVKLRRYMLFGEVAACHRAVCVCVVFPSLINSAFVGESTIQLLCIFER